MNQLVCSFFISHGAVVVQKQSLSHCLYKCTEHQAWAEHLPLLRQRAGQCHSSISNYKSKEREKPAPKPQCQRRNDWNCTPPQVCCSVCYHSCPSPLWQQSESWPGFLISMHLQACYC